MLFLKNFIYILIENDIKEVIIMSFIQKIFDGISSSASRAIKSPAGKLATLAVVDGAINGAVRPELQKRGMDARVSARLSQNGLDAVQVDFASRSIGQVTCLWQAPAKFEAQPANIIPVEDLWSSLCAAEAAAQNQDDNN